MLLYGKGAAQGSFLSALYQSIIQEQRLLDTEVLDVVFPGIYATRMLS